MLSGREYHRKMSLFNPYSVLFQIYNFSFKWYNLITYSGDGYCRFRVTLGISLTMSNEKYFFLMFYCWRLLQAITSNILVRNLDIMYVNVVRVESFSTIYSMPDTRHCLDCYARPLRCVIERQSFVPSPHWINEACPCSTTTGTLFYDNPNEVWVLDGSFI